MPHLRCHLLIGQPASGKTTLAGLLAPLLRGPDGAEAVVLSTDVIRADVFGDAAVQGPWSDIQTRLHQRLHEAVAAGQPVILDATHARRPWRLAITQGLTLPRPVEWIGWWLHTPLDVCLEWNQRRQRQVPEAVIREMAAALAHSNFGPCRAEGFAAICSLVPPFYAAPEQLVPLLRSELAALDKRIRAASNRERAMQRHGYSRLLDLERLLYLIRLLSAYPDLEGRDPGTREALEALISPLPEGQLPERAAAFLRRLHGDCYGDAEAIRGDLLWLEANGFTSAVPVQGPIQLPEATPGLTDNRQPEAGGLHGGLPPMGDAVVFQRVMTLLRHLLQHPFDHPGEAGQSLHRHLILATASIPGGYLPGEIDTLRKDIEKILTPYGFRSRHDNVRHGYSLGTAVLSAPRLREVHAVVMQAAGRLGDPSAEDLVGELQERLSWAGVDVQDGEPVRSYARHSILDTGLVRRESLAAPREAERIEKAIFERQRLVLRRFDAVGSFPESPNGALRVWPLQLVFHAIGWYLMVEEDNIGREEGLIRCERLDRLRLERRDGLRTRSLEQHRRSLRRLERLMHHCGGIYFGEDLEAQLALASQHPRQRASQLQTLRVSCAPWAFAFLREGLGRYPLEQTRYSKPLPGESWWHHPRAPHVLEPNDAHDSHPYPVEWDLPRWTLARDVDLRKWLFGFGAGIRIEQPPELRQELLQRCRAVLDLHAEASDQSDTGSAGGEEPPQPALAGSAAAPQAEAAREGDRAVAPGGPNGRTQDEDGAASRRAEAGPAGPGDPNPAAKAPRFFPNRWRRG